MISSVKRLEEAEKRRLKSLEQKKAKYKRKNDKWLKKIEKIKQNEEAELNEKQKKLVNNAQASSSSNSASATIKKLTRRVFNKILPDRTVVAMPGTLKLEGVVDMHNNFKASTQKKCLELDSQQATVITTSEALLDDAVEDLKSFDITAYEEYDEELKHRGKKSIPDWASDDEALAVAVFSMILIPDYEFKLSGGFPKPDKTYKLFQLPEK